MLYKRRTPNIFPDPDATDDLTVRGVVDWGFESSRMSGLPIQDPTNPDDVADMMRMVSDYCGFDAERLRRLEPLIRAAMADFRSDYL